MEVIKDHFYYLAVDLETTTNGYEDSPKASYKNNRILAIGTPFPETYMKEPNIINWLNKKQKNPHLLVGHSLQFDLAYLMRNHPKEPWHTYNYWCTAVAEYLISGHTITYPSLVKTLASYGTTYKKSFDVEAWLASGKRMEDVDPKLLTEYAREDAKYTSLLAELQWKRAYTIGGEKLIRLILDQSANIPALCSIELNGMSFDRTEAGTQLIANDTKIKHITDELRSLLHGVYGWPTKDLDRLNVTANRTVSAVLYGYPEEIEIGKKKKEKKGLKFNRPFLYVPTTVPNAALGYSVSEEALNGNTDVYSKLILEYRKVLKESNTYLSPLIDRSAKDKEGKVYTNINTTSTNTGRTSSSSPNFQNLPDSVRELFYSRSNTLFEIDFKQLELCAIAELSGDEQLIQDIKDGVDIHYETGKPVYGWTKHSDSDPKDRRNIKSIIFGLCYGGAAPTLSVQSGVEVSIVRAIINHFYSRYPGVKKWHYQTIADAFAHSVPITEAHPDGNVKNKTTLIIEKTGRYFEFQESPAPDWLKRKGTNWSFSPTKLKNYRAQGFAGGDIVLNYLKLLYYFIGGEASPIRLVNMIHDSIVADVPKEQEELFNESVVKARRYIEEYLKLKVPLTIEVKSSGKYWK